MQIKRIQNTKNYNTNFGSKLKITGNVEDISSRQLNVWISKAKSIGCETDIIVIDFGKPMNIDFNTQVPKPTDSKYKESWKRLVWRWYGVYPHGNTLFISKRDIKVSKTFTDNNSENIGYLCDYYNLPFYSWSYNVTYEFIFEKLLKGLEEIPEEEFKPAFDYIFIDERQDFPNVFIKVCEKVTKSKVYAAGDVFQNIFENVEGIYNVEVVLNRCYRTDPRTLMFAHATGMGLFEGKKLDWLSDDDWIKLGYKIINNENEVHLFREPINRFQELQDNNIQSVVIRNSTKIDEIMNAIAEIREQFPTVQPSDIAIIILDEGKDMYKYIENLSLNINAKHKWKVNRAFETKEQYEGSVYMTNSNNVKGLEFPFVICIASKIHDDYKQRNILYTMLTRSFLQTYLMVTNPEKLDVLQLGLSNINNNGYIKTTRPSVEEERAIKENILKFQQEQSSVSFSEFLDSIFEELEIFDEQKREKLATALANVTFNRFDKELVRDFIESNKRFY